MTVIRSHSRQLSLSIAGILALILLLGLVFVPQELRADAASHFADLAQYFDTTLSGAWRSAFTSRGSAHSASVSASQSGGGSHAGAPAILTEGETRLSAAASDSLIDINGLGLGSVGAGAASNPMTDLLRDILKDDYAESLGSLTAFASGASATGNSPAGSGKDGNHNSGVTSGPAGGARTASAARSSSGKGTQTSSAPPDLRSSDGTRRPRDAKLDVYRDRVAEPGDSFAPTFDVPGASWKHVASSESMHGSSGDNPGTDGGSGGGRYGGDNHALEPLNDDLVGQLLNGLGNPLHDAEGWGSDFQNEVSGGAGSEGDSGHLVEFGNRPNNDPKAEDHSPFNTPLATEPVSGPVSSVPEPGSLVLLSLGLGAIILGRKFRPTR